MELAVFEYQQDIWKTIQGGSLWGTLFDETCCKGAGSYRLNVWCRKGVEENIWVCWLTSHWIVWTCTETATAGEIVDQTFSNVRVLVGARVKKVVFYVCLPLLFILDSYNWSCKESNVERISMGSGRTRTNNTICWQALLEGGATYTKPKSKAFFFFLEMRWANVIHPTFSLLMILGHKGLIGCVVSLMVYLRRLILEGCHRISFQDVLCLFSKDHLFYRKKFWKNSFQKPLS